MKNDSQDSRETRRRYRMIKWQIARRHSKGQFPFSAGISEERVNRGVGGQRGSGALSRASFARISDPRECNSPRGGEGGDLDRVRSSQRLTSRRCRALRA